MTPVSTVVPVRGTTLHVEERGHGRPLLLIHGGGEDAGMLAGQAEHLAAAGYRVLSYDRRGTGRSGRHDWPGGGADQHADDAAALLEAMSATPATVLGLSVGGVVALALAARHPAVAERVVAWEPPAAGLLPDGAAASAAIEAPIDAHLAEHPHDYVGAQAILMSTILGFPVAVDDPAFAATRANAEPMIRDDRNVTLRPFRHDELTRTDVSVVIGTEALDLIRAAAARFGELTGRAPRVIDARHEVYMTDPTVLTGVLGA